MDMDNPNAGIMGLPAEAPSKIGTPAEAPIAAPAPETPEPSPAPAGTPEPETASTATEQVTPEPEQAQDDATKQKQREYQKRYQGVIEYLKAHSPETLQAYKQSTAPKRDEQGRFTPTPETPAAPAATPEQDEYIDLSDPAEFLKAVTKAVNETLDNREKATSEANQKAAWAKADADVKSQMAPLLATVPEEIAQKAFTEADTAIQKATFGRMTIMDMYHSPGGPYHAAQAVVSALNNLMTTQQVGTSTAETVAAQVAKVTAGLAATQPAPAAPPGPASALTPEKEHAKRLREASFDPISTLMGGS